VPLDYDPLLAKLTAWAPDRGAAIQRLLRALREYSIIGVETNLAFFREILEDQQFRESHLNTNFVADLFARRKPKPDPVPNFQQAAALAAAAASRNGQRETQNEKRETSRWLADGRGYLLR
jgi:acetyl/propionyl-CoA carboxylase alpha subunit